MRAKWLGLLCCMALLLGGCAMQPAAVPPRTCRIVVEQSEAFSLQKAVEEVPVGGTAVFQLLPNPGWVLTGTDHAGTSLAASMDGRTIQLTVPEVRYSAVIAVEAVHSDRSIYYDANGGVRKDGGEGCIEIPALWKHLRPNTATDLFIREGFTQIGWGTAPDENSELISMGSRTTLAAGEQQTLYAQWLPWNDSADFSYRQDGSGVTITGYSGHTDTIVIPAELDGNPVMGIAAGAFKDAQCGTIVLPERMRRVENQAFSGCTLHTLVMFDTLQSIHDGAFEGCGNLRTLRIQASCAPVYSGTYYSTFADKMDRLLLMKDQHKIVLFSGSSTRFGYDSAMIDAAFAEYGVVNMGVFAYTNAVPQLLLILDCMQREDVLIDSPELDAAKRQFCTTNQLDAPFFRMIEADYDLLARLDLREVTGVFSAYNEYRTGCAALPARSYDLSAADYDEDGAPVDTPSYNAYGDYILYRPDAEVDQPIYGLAVPYTRAAYPYQQYLAPYNAMCRRFLDRGIRMFFTWSPRNEQALSVESTPEERAALEEYIRGSIVVPVLLPLSESMVPGRLLFGTDNHLSTNGCALHTARIIEALAQALEVSE